jgi:hypothetical protein
VKLQERGAPFGGLARPAPPRRAGPLTNVIRFVKKTFAIAEMEVRKLRHDPTELLTRAVQPALWLLIFGEVFIRIRAIPTGGLRYLDFMAPGNLAQSVNPRIKLVESVQLFWWLGLFGVAVQCGARDSKGGTDLCDRMALISEHLPSQCHLPIGLEFSGAATDAPSCSGRS